MTAAIKPKAKAHPDDVMIWADGTMATREEIQRGDYDFMSDDYRRATPEEEREYWGE